ncbi:thioredoxin domain-containing protein [Paludisphaera rhizosphaerae]|uniref:hypothetical protein n=1 Tax=Paludisphaera rhizosphaerae TaxID=2711216 RepID=UPI0013EAA075|nr:hypothetical protein [Paludisphaera rhizosphaerae]
MTAELDWPDEDEVGDESSDVVAPSRDRVSLVLTALTIALVAGAAWLRFGPGFFPRPIRVGEPMPPTRLNRLNDADSRLLLGVEGRVLWLVFVSTEGDGPVPVLPELETAWKRLRSNRRFGMAVAAVDSSGPDRARQALATYKGELPLYVAGRDAPRSFGVDPGGGPWHFLIDPHGRVAAVARGSGAETINRLSKMASSWLDAMAPAADLRFQLVRMGADVGAAAKGWNIVARAPRG